MRSLATGKIKAGLGNLIGNAGEYYVVAELLKRGAVAALAPRNAPAFDILATYGNVTARIRVKTKSFEQDIWQLCARKDGTIFRGLGHSEDFTVLVDLADLRSDMTFFVVPTSKLHAWLIADFEAWLAQPGKKGKHDSKNKKRHLSYKQHARDLGVHKEKWDSLWHTGPVQGAAASRQETAPSNGQDSCATDDLQETPGAADFESIERVDNREDVA